MQFKDWEQMEIETTYHFDNIELKRTKDGLISHYPEYESMWYPQSTTGPFFQQYAKAELIKGLFPGRPCPELVELIKDLANNMGVQLDSVQVITDPQDVRNIRVMTTAKKGQQTAIKNFTVRSLIEPHAKHKVESQIRITLFLEWTKL